MDLKGLQENCAQLGFPLGWRRIFALIQTLEGSGLLQDFSPSGAFVDSRRPGTTMSVAIGLKSKSLASSWYFRRVWECSDVERRIRRTMAVSKFLFSLPAVCMIVPLLFLCVLSIYAEHSVLFMQAQSSLFRPVDMLIAGIVLTFSILIHEWGHAVACIRWGGWVSRAGLGWSFPFFLSAFVEAPSFRLFASSWRRAGVCFAGVWTSLVLLVPATSLWLALRSINAIAEPLAVICIGLLGSVVFNLLPIPRIDGYQILCQALGVRNVFRDGTSGLLMLLTKRGRQLIRVYDMNVFKKIFLVIYGFLCIATPLLILSSLAWWLLRQL
ncbi:M50 family metallopeptidase [Arachnia propionica]|uniref:M50 family peptidase n=1 Tax=Arachnia propionica TaxID=1750 RepID=A0A3P1WMU8_9ACTN|nr:M50 family metallopeptidase [Arachnia propionica]RRD47651.1 M50 family peptidase [Arachnia propionica]